MTSQSSILDAFKAWYAGLKSMKQYGGRPAKGTVAAALIVLERLRGKCELSLSSHLAEGGAQIAGLNLSALRSILTRFGERRNFPSEGGRTNRGNNKPIGQLLETLQQAGFADLAVKQRSSVLEKMQHFLVKSLDAYYNLERIRFDFDADRPARATVSHILASAQERNQAGAAAQHLVGAKLELRFPHLTIANFALSAADNQAGRQGDFQVGQTAFHVTVAPTANHAKRCARNLQEGIQAFLLVPDSQLTRARILIEDEGLFYRVAIESVESFVGQNMSELAEFSRGQLAHQLAGLLYAYNRRVKAVETDASLLIEIPAGLTQDDADG